MVGTLSIGLSIKPTVHVIEINHCYLAELSSSSVSFAAAVSFVVPDAGDR